MSGEYEHMKQAIQEARKAADAEEVPVGAVVVQDGKVVAKAHNLMMNSGNPTAHAEMLVIQRACQLLQQQRLVNCDLFVTLEPCPMCAQAISIARIRRLYFGAYDPKSGGVEHGALIYRQRSCHHIPEFYGGVHEKECSALLSRFFEEQRARQKQGKIG